MTFQQIVKRLLGVEKKLKTPISIQKQIRGAIYIESPDTFVRLDLNKNDFKLPLTLTRDSTGVYSGSNNVDFDFLGQDTLKIDGISFDGMIAYSLSIYGSGDGFLTQLTTKLISTGALTNIDFYTNINYS